MKVIDKTFIINQEKLCEYICTKAVKYKKQDFKTINSKMFNTICKLQKFVQF